MTAFRVADESPPAAACSMIAFLAGMSSQPVLQCVPHRFRGAAKPQAGDPQVIPSRVARAKGMVGRSLYYYMRQIFDHFRAPDGSDQRISRPVKLNPTLFSVTCAGAAV